MPGFLSMKALTGRSMSRFHLRRDRTDVSSSLTDRTGLQIYKKNSPVFILNFSFYNPCKFQNRVHKIAAGIEPTSRKFTTFVAVKSN